MDPKKLSMIIALFLIAVGSAYYLSEDSSGSSDTGKTAAHVDSLVADDRPTITARRDTVPEKVGEDFAPGTALIRTTILSVEEMEGEIDEIDVQVEEVLGYGSSAPPITTDTQFSFEVSHYLEQNPDVRDQITVDNQIEILVSHQEEMQAADSDDRQRWSFVEFHTAEK